MLAKGVFQHQALLPKSSWLPSRDVEVPEVSFEKYKDTTKLSWQNKASAQVFKTLIYLKYGDNWQYEIFPHQVRTTLVENSKNGQPLSGIRVLSVDRDETLSKPVIIELQ